MKLTIAGVEYDAAPVMLDVLEEIADPLDAFWAKRGELTALRESGTTAAPIKIMAGLLRSAADVVSVPIKHANPDFDPAAFRATLNFDSLPDLTEAIRQITDSAGMKPKEDTSAAPGEDQAAASDSLSASESDASSPTSPSPASAPETGSVSAEVMTSGV